MEHGFKILVKWPTRMRPDKFFAAFEHISSRALDNSRIDYLITIDHDEPYLSYYEKTIKDFLEKGFNIEMNMCEPRGKIHACNAGLPRHILTHDVIMLMSDDMICRVDHWDGVIESDMTNAVAHRREVLWYSDGHTMLNTMCVMSWVYYHHFGYIYHPDYKSLWADNEFHEVAIKLGKMNEQPLPMLFEHMHYSNSKSAHMDRLMRINESFYGEDKLVYERRKAINFGL